ncbi:MAG: excinuclease ABC subunit UvrC [Pseudomonadota bacterium]
MNHPTPPNQLERGAHTIATYVKTLPQQPGVYRMVSATGDVLYVGKAKNLPNRVKSYTHVAKLPNRLQRMVAETHSMEFVTTFTESEALLLEANFIKKFSPRYNVLLKDSKSYVYIFIQGDHPWPRMSKYRGSQKQKGDYFGPFASVEAVDDTLTALHRAFLLRSCSDNVFAIRKRPCLQYHIKRCCAPCVNYVTDAEYHTLLRQAKDVLKGHSHEIQKQLAKQMNQASQEQLYEKAAIYRDRLKALSYIQAQQVVNIPEIREADIIAGYKEGGQTCVQVFFFRQGSNYGHQAHFPQHDPQTSLPEVLKAFVTQFYAGKPPPPLLLLNHPIPELDLVQQALNISHIKIPVRGKKKELMHHAEKNAQEALHRRLTQSLQQKKLLQQLAKMLAISNNLKRIEVYDNSHIHGTAAVGAMIVAGEEGFIKSAYRKFNIKTVGSGGIKPGDDYGMLKEILTRRFKKNLSQEYKEHTLPDLIIIDGGAGQLSVTQDTLADLGIGDIPILSIAKGPSRKPGLERLFTSKHKNFRPPQDDPVFHFLQRLRDEAHRFAIGTHRAKRAKGLGTSMLESIPGIGPRRKKALLQHFGSAKNVARAGLKDLEAVEGISTAMAKAIFEHLK